MNRFFYVFIRMKSNILLKKEVINMQLKRYNRQKAIDYARKWALDRNPIYHDYEKYGGDCTNFISQCLHAGEIPFDESGKDITKKWYWYSDYSRTPSWTAAEPLEAYLLGNNKKNTQNYGIYASFCDYEDMELGDLVQKRINGQITHTMIVTSKVLDRNGRIIDYLVCQHTYDLKDFPLSQKDGVLSYIKIHGYYA